MYRLKIIRRILGGIWYYNRYVIIPDETCYYKWERKRGKKKIYSRVIKLEEYKHNKNSWYRYNLNGVSKL